MNKRHYEHTLSTTREFIEYLQYINDMLRCNKENRNGGLKLATG